jgi:hypothetical protein
VTYSFLQCFLGIISSTVVFRYKRVVCTSPVPSAPFFLIEERSVKLDLYFNMLE